MKCVILCMCCNDPFYLKQWDDVCQSWAKDIMDGKYNNIDIWMYTASKSSEYRIDRDKHIIYVPCIDSLDQTFVKTVKAIQSLSIYGIEYDAILRTNCSTIINVKMLDTMLTKGIDVSKVHVGSLYLLQQKSAPYSYDAWFSGNFILFSRAFADMINMSSFDIAKQLTGTSRVLHKDLFTVDDLTISAIFNAYMHLNNKRTSDVYHIVNVQQLSYVYSNIEKLNPNCIAYFNKCLGDNRPLSQTYEAYREQLFDFYENGYQILSTEPSEANQVGELRLSINKRVSICTNPLDKMPTSEKEFEDLYNMTVKETLRQLNIEENDK